MDPNTAVQQSEIRVLHLQLVVMSQISLQVRWKTPHEHHACEILTAKAAMLRFLAHKKCMWGSSTTQTCSATCS